MKTASPRPLRNPEVVANLWVYADEDGLIARLAGKAYVLDGTDREKLDLLRQLAASDFLSAEWQPIPKNFGLIGPDGQRLNFAQLHALQDENTKAALVGPLLDKLASSLPPQLCEVDGEYQQFSMKMPEAPLTVLTVVMEYPDGRLVPVLNEG